MAQGEGICLPSRRYRFDPWVGKKGSPSWGGKLHPTPVFLPGKPHGQRSLVGCSHWGCRVGHDLVTTPPPPHSLVKRLGCESMKQGDLGRRQVSSTRGGPAAFLKQMPQRWFSVVEGCLPVSASQMPTFSPPDLGTLCSLHVQMSTCRDRWGWNNFTLCHPVKVKAVSPLLLCLYTVLFVYIMDKDISDQ